ncbi:hypothetical protein BH11VER1_BH11VER1_05810 [soil metagenome]
MKMLTFLLVALFLVGCHSSKVSPAFKLNAIKYGESWMNAFEVLGGAGLQDSESVQATRKECQPLLNRLKSVSGEEKKIYDEALFLDRALAYLSENSNKPVEARYPDDQLNKALGIKDGKLPENPAVLAKALRDLLIRYMTLCR